MLKIHSKRIEGLQTQLKTAAGTENCLCRDIDLGCTKPDDVLRAHQAVLNLEEEIKRLTLLRFLCDEKNEYIIYSIKRITFIWAISFGVLIVILLIIVGVFYCSFKKEKNYVMLTYLVNMWIISQT
ncbi:hypothetical protein CEXT_212661 [Caerostris extrusa]|uniref:Uncharacterized protein n=1 Tax=Caerostris extrusa TaxID=172846 RepID=A0AAV4R0Q4_CAEEX|nr:hypothetical protein CEXT_212661 [Caerostris extrusa]